MASDWKRAIQSTRKDLDLDVTDRITVTFDGEVPAAVVAHQAWVQSETLATDVSAADLSGEEPSPHSVNGQSVRFRVTAVRS